MPKILTDEERRKSTERMYKQQYEWQKKNRSHITVVVPNDVKDAVKKYVRDGSINAYVNDLIVKDMKEKGYL